MKDFYLADCKERSVHAFLNRLLSNDGEEVCLHFYPDLFLIPFSILALLIWIMNRKKAGLKTYAANYQQCTYLQRMNFFSHAGLEIREAFIRHRPCGRFLPITELSNNDRSTDEFAETFADTLIPSAANSFDPQETSKYDCICYCISELANNVIQHSRGTGYCFAQTYPQKNLLRISIADNGIGIKASLEGTPHIREDDLNSIKQALRPNVSGRAWRFAGESPNAGVGLSLLVEIARASGGYFFVCSGNAVCSSLGDYELPSPLHGTVIGLTIPLSFFDGKNFYQNVLVEAKTNLHLLNQNDDKRFQEVFI